MTEKTIRKHINNVGFYINDFLNYYKPTQMKKGCHKIDEFLGDWFIRKAMWSNPTSIKQNAARRRGKRSTNNGLTSSY